MVKQDKDEQELQAASSDGKQNEVTVKAEAENIEEGQENQLAELQAQLDEAQAKAAENLDGWQRAQAEFANYKKRQARDLEVQSAEARARIIKRYLEILDDLERALASRPAEGAGAEWAQGVELIYRKLQSYIQGEGVTLMEVLGQPFDPNLHEAIAKETNPDYESGVVIEVVQPGYMIGERVLRPAVVKVAE